MGKRNFLRKELARYHDSPAETLSSLFGDLLQNKHLDVALEKYQPPRRLDTCIYCGERCYRAAHLTWHRKYYHGVNYRCPVGACRKLFMTATACDAHEQAEHPWLVNYEFSRKVSVGRHPDDPVPRVAAVKEKEREEEKVDDEEDDYGHEEGMDIDYWDDFSDSEDEEEDGEENEKGGEDNESEEEGVDEEDVEDGRQILHVPMRDLPEDTRCFSCGGELEVQEVQHLSAPGQTVLMHQCIDCQLLLYFGVSASGQAREVEVY